MGAFFRNIFKTTAIINIKRNITMEKYPTPIETLMKFKGQEITVELRNKEKVRGELVAFDLSTNLTLETSEGTRFIQGSSVNFVYGQEDEIVAEATEEAKEPAKEEAEAKEVETPTEAETAEKETEPEVKEEATAEEETPTEETPEPKEAEETEVAEEVSEKAE